MENRQYDRYLSDVPASQNVDPQKVFPMKWFKFVIWVQLFLSALSTLISGIQCLSGGHYGDQADTVYAMFPNLKGVDQFYGIALIALAAFCIYARMRLAGFKVNGPKMYYIVLICNLVMPLLYMFRTTYIIQSSPYGNAYPADYSYNIGSMVGLAVMFVCNVYYFQKRKDLFIN